MGQLPVTCGLFFSLGHSTIVIAVNVAIAISTSVYDHINGVGDVGGIVGTAVSASFLFIVGLANSIILWRVVAKRRRLKKEKKLRLDRGEDPDTIDEEFYHREAENHGNTLMMKLLGPIVTFVDKPWKMYPVGVLFGFGFDTASSIALLAVSAIAKKDSNGNQIPSGYIVILPLLFTTGMTLIDSVDSIIMLYSYSGFPDRKFALVERSPSADSSSETARLQPDDPESPASPGAKTPPVSTEVVLVPASPVVKTPSPIASVQALPHTGPADILSDSATAKRLDDDDGRDDERKRQMRVKQNAMSGLSIALTLMSILVAFAISLIEIMGLIGDNCGPCQDAANDPGGGGLAGRWWRGWDAANDNSGYIGAAIVGSFVAIVGAWYGGRYVWRKLRTRHLEI
ncbi:NicO-domain-containing protein [Phanerochaete sordida]|uniref:Nickel/cobalt efflux system n=1 Tax=Phanerochaete sordida TaxID=48140 RepID=A0A9P3LB78_9APHY|nr:NicO-domain-containing protein [Phanerochaete sordida]